MRPWFLRMPQYPKKGYDGDGEQGGKSDDTRYLD